MRNIRPIPKSYSRSYSSGVTLGKWFLIAEFGLFLYTYSIYRKLNRNQEYRYMFHKKYPWVLDKFYLVGEKLGGLETRKEDLDYWTQYENSKKES